VQYGFEEDSYEDSKGIDFRLSLMLIYRQITSLLQVTMSLKRMTGKTQAADLSYLLLFRQLMNKEADKKNTGLH
jgi:hypothetical protein